MQVVSVKHILYLREQPHSDVLHNMALAFHGNEDVVQGRVTFSVEDIWLCSTSSFKWVCLVALDQGALTFGTLWDRSRLRCHIKDKNRRMFEMQTSETRQVWESLVSTLDNLQEKQEEIWLSPMTKTLKPTETSIKQPDNTKNATTNSITQRLLTD